MLPRSDEPLAIADKRNSTQFHVGNVGADPMDGRVALSVDLVTIVVLVPRRRLVDHQ